MIGPNTRPLCGYQLQHWCYSACLGLYFSCGSTRSVCKNSEWYYRGFKCFLVRNHTSYNRLYSIYQNKATIIKVVLKTNFLVLYILAAHHLQPYARSIICMEACSAVPLYKTKK
jgi:hypothetical protein